MSLFASIQQSANALTVAQLGLNVTGNNIANANTPGYIRQELLQTTAVGYKYGDITLGYGVRAQGVRAEDRQLYHRTDATNRQQSRRQ